MMYLKKFQEYDLVYNFISIISDRFVMSTHLHRWKAIPSGASVCAGLIQCIILYKGLMADSCG
jgi:hypothetical protein